MSETVDRFDDTDIYFVTPDKVALYGGPLDGREVRVYERDRFDKGRLFFVGSFAHEYETRWEMDIDENGKRRCTYSLVWPKIPRSHTKKKDS
jgi:hypothetical protein